MNNAFLILGGNLGEREKNLSLARDLIELRGNFIKKTSPIYETEPWGVENQPPYYNQVVEILTERNATDLLYALLQIEKEMGRTRNAKNDPRNIDIDILFFNEEIHSGDLIVPHPRLQDRRFVLEPLAAIAPEFMHPVLQKTVAELLKDCADTSIVKKL